MIINRLMQQLSNYISDLFHGSDMDSGVIVIQPCETEQEIFVPLYSDIVNVWFNLTSLSSPVCGGSVCYISEPVFVPDGFVFKVRTNAECLVKWFAILR